jgi:hypothetical protein
LQQRRLVQDLLEPQLVHLMDDDEQQLVVRVGRGALAGEQVVQAQVASVRPRGALGTFHATIIGDE